MTKRQRLIKDVTRHLKGHSPKRLTAKRIQEAITDLGKNDTADEYDWPRLRNAIARRHHKRHTARKPWSDITRDQLPALSNA